MHYGKELIVIDPGYLGTTNSATAWASFTLMPEIIKKTGTLTIDHLIVLQLNSATLEAVATLCSKMTVKKLYLPWWSGKLKGGAWHNYKKLNYILYKNGGERIALNTTPVILQIADQQPLSLKPTGKTLKYNTITYPAFYLDGTIDNHSFTIYAAKHTKAKRIS